jgi:hydroxypyruvate isomerase
MKPSAVPGRTDPLSRRSAIKRISAGAALAGAFGGISRPAPGQEQPQPYKAKGSRINQSVIYWCFKPMQVEELARHAAQMGIKSVELVTPEYWPMLKKLGLTCALTPSHGFAKGFARKEDHAECLEVLRKRIDDSAEAGFPSVITFSGFRKGVSDEEGMKNMVEGLKQVVGHAEKRKVTLCLEMLNSRVNIEMKGHPDYFCDRMEMAVDVCKQVGSERMKVLFDIYHVQIMEGDLIARIKQFHPWIGHYHTAGVPGRNELDDTQEINYAAVMRVIAETGYKGYVGQEFIPTRDKVVALNEAVRLCDV